jgi:ketosteroid isomerase-like protein
MRETAQLMSQHNVEFVRRALESVRAGKPDLDTVDEDVEIHDHDIPERGEYRGREGLTRWLEDWGAARAEWSFQPEEFIDAGNRVVAIFRMKARGRGSGAEVERRDAILYELRDDKIVRLDYYNDPSQALEAAGLKAT